MVEPAGAQISSIWTFLTNHAHVLVCLDADPDLRGWEIAQRVGITERATQKIITDLAHEGYLTRTRVGRRNRYDLNRDVPLRHPLESGHTVGELLAAIAARPPEPARARRSRS
jgi:hypothetical protein